MHIDYIMSRGFFYLINCLLDFKPYTFCRRGTRYQFFKDVHLIDTPCPYDNWVATARKSCNDPDRYHCLNDEFSRPGWICADPIWVEADWCPKYNTRTKKITEVKCYGSNCPISTYRSSRSHLYEDCRSEVKTSTKHPFSSTQSPNNGSASVSIGVVLGSIFGILGLLLVTFSFIFYYRRKKKSKSESRDIEERMVMLDISESDAQTALERSCRALRTERFVVLTGIQGAGKTFLAERLYEKCIDCEKFWIRHLNQFPKEVDQKGPISYFLDDLFYELQSGKEVEEVKKKIDTLYERTVVRGNGQIILTITSLIRRRHESLFNERKCQNLIDLDQLCLEDCEDILKFHMNLSGIVPENKDYDDPSCPSMTVYDNVRNIVLKDCNPEFKSLVANRGIGMASSIAFACQFQNRNYSKDILVRFIKTPLSWCHSYWKNIIDDNWTGTTVMFVLMAIQNVELDINRIDQMCLTKIKEIEDIQNMEEFPAEELDELVKKRFIEKTDDDKYRFQISTDKKVLLRLILQKHPELEEFCDQEMLRRRAYRLESLPGDIKGAYVKTFVLMR